MNYFIWRNARGRVINLSREKRRLLREICVDLFHRSFHDSTAVTSYSEICNIFFFFFLLKNSIGKNPTQLYVFETYDAFALALFSTSFFISGTYFEEYVRIWEAHNLFQNFLDWLKKYIHVSIKIIKNFTVFYNIEIYIIGLWFFIFFIKLQMRCTCLDDTL